MVNEPDIVVLGRLSSASSSAMPTSAATRSTAALEATASATALKTAAPAGELLTARGTPLGKSSGLSPVAGAEGGALRGEVAAPTSSGTLS